MKRRTSRWIGLAALAPVLAVAVYLPGQMLRCRIDGLLRPACCCPQEAEAQSSGPVVRPQDCCDREVALGQRPTVAATRVADRDAAGTSPLAAITAPLAVVVSATEPSERARGRHGPAREGPPIVLLKHAFLI